MCVSVRFVRKCVFVIKCVCVLFVINRVETFALLFLCLMRLCGLRVIWRVLLSGVSIVMCCLFCVWCVCVLF